MKDTYTYRYTLRDIHMGTHTRRDIEYSRRDITRVLTEGHIYGRV